MLEISTKITGLNQIIEALEMLGQANLPHLAKAVKTATEAVQQQWVNNAMSAFKHSTGQYLDGIDEGFRYPYNGDPYAGAVINTVPYASNIEDGTPPHDMKKALFTSSKVRISKKGKRYLIIPFRHGTTRSSRKDKVTGLQIEAGRGDQRATMVSMPKSIYNIVKKEAFVRSTTKSKYLEQSLNHPDDPKKTAIRRTYGWKSRLTEHQIKQAGADTLLQSHHKTNIYEGMVRMKAGKLSSIFMTFRIMHEDSKGWFHPGTPPLKLAEKTANQIRPQVIKLLKEGYKRDCKELGLEVR